MSNFASRTIVSIKSFIKYSQFVKTYFFELVSGFFLNLDQTTALISGL